MLPNRRKELLDDLAAIILDTSDQDAIDNARMQAYYIIQKLPKKTKSDSYNVWLKRWKNSVRPGQINKLKELSKNFPKEALPIFNIFDSLKTEQFKIFIEHKKQENPKIFKRVKNSISDQLVVKEVIKILTGKTSDIFSFNSYGKLTTDETLAQHQQSVLQYITRFAKSQKLIEETSDAFTGLIGAAVRDVIESEYHEIKADVHLLEDDNVTLIKLLSIISGPILDGMLSLSLFCYCISTKTHASILNSIAYCQSHGTPSLCSIGSKMIDAGIDELLLFIRNWVAFGILKDDFSEFFVSKTKGNVESSLWWATKYVLLEDRIPIFLNDPRLIKKIYNSGRARNYVIKYKDSCSNYYQNYGNSAPFALHFPEPKAKPQLPSRWTGPPFSLSMVNDYYKDAIDAMKYMNDCMIWLEGHLTTVRDFILYARGDFAKALYDNFSESEDGDAATLFGQAIIGVTDGTKYRNTITEEHLNDRVDLAQKWSIQPRLEEIKLEYLTNPPIDTFFPKSILGGYYRIGHFIWLLKVSEYKLSDTWKMARHIQYLSRIGRNPGSFLLMTQLRHLMLLSLQAVIEYISTDIIFCNFNRLMKDVEDTEDYDDAIALHQDFVRFAEKGALQTDDFKEVKAMVLEMIEFASQFYDMHMELDNIYNEILEYCEAHDDWEHRGKRFLAAKAKEIVAFKGRTDKMFAGFNDVVSRLYLYVYDHPKDPEMVMLETRLRPVAINIH